jgi:hypothetical protein
MFGWEKKEAENVTPKELKRYRNMAKIYLGYTEQQMNPWVNDTAFQNGYFIFETNGAHLPVALPAIRMDHTARLNWLQEKTVEVWR